MDAAVLVNLRDKAEKRNRINLSFYPEGGNTVIGLRSRITFKATGDEGDLEKLIFGVRCIGIRM